MQIAARLAVDSIPAERRSKARVELASQGQLSGWGFHGMDVTISDLSEDGFRARAGRHIPAGSLVRLKMPGLGIVIGKVAWSRRGEVGGAFVNKVSESRLRSIVGFKLPERVAVAEPA